MSTDFTIEHGGVEHHYEMTIRAARPNNNPYAALEAAAREKKAKYAGLKNLHTIVISPGGMVDRKRTKHSHIYEGYRGHSKATTQ